MDFNTILQLRTKRFWWVDVIYYFAISLLIATVLCYALFLVKNSMQRQEIEEVSAKLEAVGTQDQKDQEAEVIKYQKKIKDFTELFLNHEFASNVFAFIQKQTMSNVWFKQFSLDRKNRKVQLSGESDSMESLSRQIKIFEKSEYVASLSGLSSTLGDLAKTQFNFSLQLKPEIFSFLAKSSDEDLVDLENIPDLGGEVSPSGQQLVQPGLNNQNLITFFSLVLSPEAVGKINQQQNTILFEVPFGTDVKSIRTSIVISPDATVVPGSGVFQDFTNPVNYRVTAEDGTFQDYIATVNILPENFEASEKNTGSVMVLLIIVIVTAVVAAVIIVAVYLLIKRRRHAS